MQMHHIRFQLCLSMKVDMCISVYIYLIYDKCILDINPFMPEIPKSN